MNGNRKHTHQGRTIVFGTAVLALSGCYQGIPLPGPEQNDSFATTSQTPGGDSTGGSSEGTGGETDGGVPGGLDCAGEASWTRDVLEQKCAGCHSGATAQGNFDYVTDLTRLATSGLIKGGDPEASPLFRRIADGQMPPSGIGEPLDADEQARLSDFIEFCADEPLPECDDNVPVSITDQLLAMSDDLTSIDADDREFTRYFTLTHLHNAGYCDADIDLYRHAVAKLINSLSAGATVVAPVAIDDLNTIYRIDLRDYEWDGPFGEFDNRWEAIVGTAAYSVERLEDEAETLKLFTGTDIPFMLGDAFVEIASQPPLYHDLAGIPETLSELEAQLGMSIEADVAAEEVVRAGLLDSEVSNQNRIVERHDIQLGFGRSFWLSYDFSDDSLESQNIFASPLDFEQQAGEVIFTLPNGMQAYLLFDANGNRIDVAADDIVNDPKQEDQRVRNGVSCFGCHSGVIEAQDEIRDHVLGSLDFDAQTKDTVAAIYPPSDELTTVFESDTQRYRSAIELAGVPADASLEPISETFARFRFNVTLERAAAELGISEQVLLTQLGGLDPALGTLQSGSVKRDTWTALYAQTVCELNLGRTDSCPDLEPNDDDGGTGGDSGESGGTSGATDGGGSTGYP